MTIHDNRITHFLRPGQPFGEALCGASKPPDYPLLTTTTPKSVNCDDCLRIVLSPDYRGQNCKHCGRQRVLVDGVCEKCLWDNDADEFAFITRPKEYDTQGPVFVDPDEGLTL